MSTINAAQALVVLRDAELLCPAEAVTAALDRLAAAITARLKDCDPLVLVVMTGALLPGAQVLVRLSFPCQIDYLHATRYRGMTSGGEIHWLARPSVPLAGRVVLVVDDIFDEGITLKAILAELRRGGAREVLSAVLVNKLHDRKEPGLSVDFIGLEVTDRYVFGCGMDYKGYWRNLPAIYAVRETSLP
jgi:hypoxanthine phosphoribosyltransferase